MRGGQRPGAGRPAGTPNKVTASLRERLAEAMGEDWCPIVELARIAADPETDRALRVRCLSEVAPYFEARRKAIELNTHKTWGEYVAESFGIE